MKLELKVKVQGKMCTSPCDALLVLLDLRRRLSIPLKTDTLLPMCPLPLCVLSAYLERRLHSLCTVYLVGIPYRYTLSVLYIGDVQLIEVEVESARNLPLGEKGEARALSWDVSLNTSSTLTR